MHRPHLHTGARCPAVAPPWHRGVLQAYALCIARGLHFGTLLLHLAQGLYAPSTYMSPVPRLPQQGGSQRAADEVEAEEQSWAVAGLVREAAREFGRPDAVYAASDFHTFHVPPRRPQQEQQQQQ